MDRKRLAIVGCGHLGNIVTDACCKGFLPEYELAGVLGRDEEHAAAMAEKGNCPVCRSLEELLEKKPDYVAEMASVQTVKDIAETVLSHGANLIVLSIGAFADQEFYRRVQETARKYKTRVHIASGAIGGFDVLRTISLMEAAGGRTVQASMVTEKGPKSLEHSPLFQEHLMTDTQKAEVFSGSTKDAIAILPTHVNVSVAASLATSGTEQLDFRIFSVPGMTGDDHKITAEGEGLKATVDVYSQVSDIAGWSVVALLQNLVSPIMF